MTSLADELMNDLDDLGSGSELDDELDAAVAGPSGTNGGRDEAMAGDEGGADEDGEAEGGAGMEDVPAGEVHVPEGGIKPAEELDSDAVNQMDLTGVAEVGKVAKLQNGRTMREVLQVRAPHQVTGARSLTVTW